MIAQLLPQRARILCATLREKRHPVPVHAAPPALCLVVTPQTRPELFRVHAERLGEVVDADQLARLWNFFVVDAD